MQIQIEASASIEAATDGEENKYPTVSMVAYGGGPITVKGYRYPVVIDLDGVGGLGRSMPLLMSHDHGRIVGHGTPERDGNTLTVSGIVGAENDDSRQVVQLAKSGFPWRASVGAQVNATEEVKKGSSVVVNGQSVAGPLIIARKTFVYETSFTAVPADSSTIATVAASKILDKGDGMDFVNFVEAAGFDHGSLTETQRSTLQLAFDKQQHSDTGKTVESVIEAAKQRDNRSKNYARVIEAAIANGMDTPTAERLIEAANRDQLSETEFELQVLRLQRAPSFNTQRQSGGDVSAEIVEAAVARSIGGDAVECFKPEVLEASEKRFKHGISLVELMQLSARRNGARDISHRDSRALLQAAFAPIEAAGASTYSLPGVLSNLANKMLRQGFMSVESEWRKIASIRSVNDLKATTSYSLAGDFKYKEVGPSGELTHATMSEEAYTNQAKTYGRLFSITRRDILNDDLGAFQRVRMMLGRGAATEFNRIFWTEFLKDLSTFYTTGRKNKIASSATTPLGIDSLSEAWTKFGEKTDPDGLPLGLEPAVLVVPNGLKIIGTRLTQDPEIRVNGASSKTTYTTGNPHAGKLELCSSVYLANSQIANSSAKNYFLFADPLDMPVMEVAFLYSRETPFIESADADFDTLGIQMRGYHDFGVAKTEYRGALMVEDLN